MHAQSVLTKRPVITSYAYVCVKRYNTTLFPLIHLTKIYPKVENCLRESAGHIIALPQVIEEVFPHFSLDHKPKPIQESQELQSSSSFAKIPNRPLKPLHFILKPFLLHFFCNFAPLIRDNHFLLLTVVGRKLPSEIISYNELP